VDQAAINTPPAHSCMQGRQRWHERSRNAVKAPPGRAREVVMMRTASKRHKKTTSSSLLRAREVVVTRMALCWALSTSCWAVQHCVGLIEHPLAISTLRWPGSYVLALVGEAGDMAHDRRTSQPNSRGCGCPCWHARERMGGLGWQVPAREVDDGVSVGVVGEWRICGVCKWAALLSLAQVLTRF